jgi:hypothetical protein
MGFFSKIGKGFKKLTSNLGATLKKVGGVALPIIGGISALAIPGIGGAVGSTISNISAKLFGGQQGGATDGISPALLPNVADRPDGSGGLFGKGGLMGTGLFASREWTQFNKTLKWAKQDTKVLEKASKAIGVDLTSMDQLKKVLSPAQIEQIEQEAYNELVTQGETPPTGTDTDNKESDNSTLVKIGVGALVAKVLGIF